MKCHPDLFPEKSQEFKDLQQAYERLMNWEKEKPHFDRTEHFKKKGPGSQEKIFQYNYIELFHWNKSFQQMNISFILNFEKLF